MLARSVLITGCNRGIGLELVKQWLKIDGPPEHIIATCRKPDEVKKVKKGICLTCKTWGNIYLGPRDIRDTVEVRQSVT
jgi:NAD(P)-dependent dehydrogenase (short-subunit alcohol dehydrogenase family)